MLLNDEIPLKNGGFMHLGRNTDTAQRRFVLSLHNCVYKVTKDTAGLQKRVAKIEGKGEIILQAGEEFMFCEEPYKVEYIETTSLPDTFTIIIDQLTVSSLFLLPMLGYNTNYFEVGRFLVNCYAFTDLDPEAEPSIYLLYRFNSGDEDYEALESRLLKHTFFVKQFHPDNYSVLYKFKLPEVVYPDYFKVMEGKYSQLSEPTKDIIFNFNRVSSNNEESMFYGIFNKTEARRKELGAMLNMKLPLDVELYEHFNIDDNTYEAPITKRMETSST